MREREKKERVISFFETNKARLIREEREGEKCEKEEKKV